MDIINVESLSDYIPSEPHRRIPQAIQYLRGDDALLPPASTKGVLIPDTTWRSGGHLMGRAISHLAFPDNTIIIVGSIADRQGIFVPPADTGILFNIDGLSPLAVDQELINLLQLIFTGEQPPTLDVRTDVFGANPQLFATLPMMLEASRIRKKGEPRITPILVGTSGTNQLRKLGLFLEHVTKRCGAGIVFVSDNLSEDKQQAFEYQHALQSLSPLLMGAFNNSFEIEKTFQYFCHGILSSVHCLASTPVLLEDGGTKIGSSYMSAFNAYAFPVIPPSAQCDLWKSVLRGLQHQPPQPLKSLGMPVSCIVDVFSEGFSARGQYLAPEPVFAVVNKAASALEVAAFPDDDLLVEVSLIHSVQPLRTKGGKMSGAISIGKHGILGRAKDGANKVLLPQEIVRRHLNIAEVLQIAQYWDDAYLFSVQVAIAPLKSLQHIQLEEKLDERTLLLEEGRV